MLQLFYMRQPVLFGDLASCAVAVALTPVLMAENARARSRTAAPPPRLREQHRARRAGGSKTFRWRLRALDVAAALDVRLGLPFP